MQYGELFYIDGNQNIDIEAIHDVNALEKSVALLISRQDFIAHLPELQANLQIEINPHHVSDILNAEHPSFYDSTADYEMIILRTIYDLKTINDIKPVLQYAVSSYVFLCFNNILIIIHNDDPVLLSRFQGLFTQSKKNKCKNPLSLLYFSLNFLLDQFLLFRAPATQQFKCWQRLMLDENSSFKLWNELINYKSEIEAIADLCEDIEDMLEDWRRYTRYQMEQEFIINLNDLDNHNQRAIHIIEKLGNNIDTLIQLHFSALSHRNNQILRVLAIISAIFLPLTLITGIFGMNFTNMPILHVEYAYYLTMGVMFLLGLILMTVFRLKRWI